MKRILKFRIWDYAAEAFVDDGAGQIIYECCYDGEVEYQQYTGLKDKNGVEIYEGDIVSGKFYDTDYMSDELVTCPVKWIEQSASFNIGHHYWTRSSIKIIGNIFENSELLK